jgi:Flp pilus assembly protein TadG
MKNVSITRKFKSLLKDTGGSLTPMFAIAAVPFILAAGAAIDMSRVNREQSSFYNALDSAAIAIAADDRSALEGLSKSQAETKRAALEAYAEKYVKANYTDASDGATTIDVKLKITGKAIDIDATMNVPMTFMKLGGINDIELKYHTQVKKAMRPVELVMVLDTTGSMGAAGIQALQNGANGLLKNLYSDGASKNMQSENIRIALVPFSSAVHLDTAASDFSLSWIDTTGLNPLSRLNFNDPTWNNFTAWGKTKANASTYNTWNGCVESRQWGSTETANLIASDAAPDSSKPETLFPAFFNPDSPSWFKTSSGNAYDYMTSASTVVSRNSNNWGNEYIGVSTDYVNGTSAAATLPGGAFAKGYDDSTIGNNVWDFNSRYYNVKKYEDTVIGVENVPASDATRSYTQNNGPWKGCTASKVVPMTYDRSKVEYGITKMKSAGSTNIAEGLAWGMRVISPGAPFTQVEGVGSISGSTIAPYNGPRWQKFLVLMSDGDNDPGAGSGFVDTSAAYNALGSVLTPLAGGLNRYNTNNAAIIKAGMDSNTLAMCTKLKNLGVTIYSIAYATTDKPLLRDCATSPNNHYKRVGTSIDLVAYFDHIGQDVLNKMVYVSQ